MFSKTKPYQIIGLMIKSPTIRLVGLIGVILKTYVPKFSLDLAATRVANFESNFLINTEIYEVSDLCQYGISCWNCITQEI